MLLRAALLAVMALPLTPIAGCSAPEMVFDIRTEPAGASVFLSRRGEKAVEGKLGFISGDVKTEPFVEEFMALGTAPVEHSSPLQERESGASALGVGVVVVRRYDAGMIRVEKDGYETVERLMRFADGEVLVEVELQPARGPGAVSQNLD